MPPLVEKMPHPTAQGGLRYPRPDGSKITAQTDQSGRQAFFTAELTCELHNEPGLLSATLTHIKSPLRHMSELFKRAPNPELSLDSMIEVASVLLVYKLSEVESKIWGNPYVALVFVSTTLDNWYYTFSLRPSQENLKVLPSVLATATMMGPGGQELENAQAQVFGSATQEMRQNLGTLIQRGQNDILPNYQELYNSYVWAVAQRLAQLPLTEQVPSSFESHYCGVGRTRVEKSGIDRTLTVEFEKQNAQKVVITLTQRAGHSEWKLSTTQADRGTLTVQLSMPSAQIGEATVRFTNQEKITKFAPLKLENGLRIKGRDQLEGSYSTEATNADIHSLMMYLDALLFWLQQQNTKQS